MIVFIHCGVEQATNQAAEKIDREFTPNAAIPRTVENVLGDVFEQRIRGCEINELVALMVGYEFSAALDE